MDISTSSQPTPPHTKKEEQHEPAAPPRRRSVDVYSDYSDDLVERVRAARAAAQRQMEAFGDVSEYEIRIIQGQKKEDSETPADVGGTSPNEPQP